MATKKFPPDENAPRRPQTDKDTGVGTFVPDPGLDDDADDVGYASGDEAQTAPLEDEESGTPPRRAIAQRRRRQRRWRRP